MKHFRTLLVLSFTFFSLMFNFDIQATKSKRPCRKAAAKTSQPPKKSQLIEGNNSGYKKTPSSKIKTPSKKRAAKEISSSEEESDIETLETPSSIPPIAFCNSLDYLRAINGDKNLIDAKLQGTNLSELDLNGVDLTNADLRGAKLIRTKLKGAILHNTKLSGATLAQLSLKNAVLVNTDLSQANLVNVSLINVWLEDSNFIGAKLENVTFRTNKIIKNVNFYHAIFTNSHFIKCRVENLEMKYAQADRLLFIKTSLQNSNFSHAILKGMFIINPKTSWKKINFRYAKIINSWFVGSKPSSKYGPTVFKQTDFLLAELFASSFVNILFKGCTNIQLSTIIGTKFNNVAFIISSEEEDQIIQELKDMGAKVNEEYDSRFDDVWKNSTT